MEETPRASDLQIQVEQVNLALRQLRQTQESLNGLETRLNEMTRECAGILDRWAQNDERHATAVVELHSRLGEWNDIERRLLNESTSRIHQFERSLQHEWQAIRQSHEEPLRQIEAQTTRVTEACLTAVDQALRGFDRAETRLGNLEQDLQREMGTLSREVREAVAELRQGAPQVGPRQPWSLDNVVRLHNELRADGSSSQPSGGRGTLALAEAVEAEAPPRVARELPPIEATSAQPPGSRRFRWVAGAVIAAVVLFAIYVQAQVRAGLREATERAAAAERGAEATRQRAARDIAVAQQAADARLVEAQQAARSAQMLALIASAADLLRFDLVGRQGQSAQVLWSRTQGVSVNARGLAAPPPGKTYQVWLISPGRATSAGMLQVDGTGRARAIFDSPAGLPRPVGRAAITVEPAGGSPEPTGPAVLAPAVLPPAVLPPPAS
jgi:Anti-sigma-K factor rskA